MKWTPEQVSQLQRVGSYTQHVLQVYREKPDWAPMPLSEAWLAGLEQADQDVQEAYDEWVDCRHREDPNAPAPPRLGRAQARLERLIRETPVDGRLLLLYLGLVDFLAGHMRKSRRTPDGQFHYWPLYEKELRMPVQEFLDLFDTLPPFPEGDLPEEGFLTSH